MVSSAKSWLCVKDAADEACLPFEGEEDAIKVSPITASASYLHYLRQAWNHSYPEAPLEDQDITLTIPASFDEAARQATLEAAARAGLPTTFLLEEPQAVCYPVVQPTSP